MIISHFMFQVSFRNTEQYEMTFKDIIFMSKFFKFY